MNQEIEIEFKNLLTREEYELLYKEYFSSQSGIYTQKNIYYDTTSYDLKRMNCALRIRIKEKNAEFTLKSPFEGHHKELNLPLTLEEADELISAPSIPLPAPIGDFLKTTCHLDIDSVSKIAELTTERIEKEYRGCLLVLDKSWYCNTVDYEIEIESPSIEQGKDLFEYILNKHAIANTDTPNKISRAHNAWNKDT